MIYAVYYKNRQLSESTAHKAIAQGDLARLKICFKGLKVKQVSGEMVE